MAGGGQFHEPFFFHTLPNEQEQYIGIGQCLAGIEHLPTVVATLVDAAPVFARWLDRHHLEALERVGLSPETAGRYPHQLSGGQKQRVNIARVLTVRPKVIVCDEVVAALDVSIRGDVLNLFSDLQREFGLTYVFITHDISVVSHVSDRVAVTYLGKLMELGPTEDVIEQPLHPAVLAKGAVQGREHHVLRRIEAVTGTGPIERLRREEAELATVAERIGVPRAELLDGIDKRLAELRDLRAEVRSLRSKVAAGGAAELAASAIDGVVVARVDGLARDDLRSLGVAVRDQAGVRAVVLIGAPEGGGVALVSATEKGGDLDAGALIADAARTVGGGGGKNPELAVAGGRDASRIDEALDQARAAAGIA